MNKRAQHGHGTIIWTVWAAAVVLGLAALHPGFRHLAQTAVRPHRDQIRLLLLLTPVIIALLTGARKWKGWRNEWRDLKHLLPHIPRLWVLSIAGPLLWALAFAWGVVFVPLSGLTHKLFGRRPVGGRPEEWRRVTLNERQAQERDARHVLSAWLGPLLFLAVAGDAAVATRTSIFFPAAAANLTLSFWANGLWASLLLGIGSKIETYDVSGEMAMLKRAGVVGLATAVVAAALLTAA